MASRIPLRYKLEIAQLVEITDRFNNKVMVPGVYQPVLVAGWAIVNTKEQTGESVLRTIDQLDIYSPEAFSRGTQVRLPDGSVWQVQGNAEDYRHGPWWNPELVIIHAVQVKG